MGDFYRYIFRIIGTSPQDIPMGRLADYMGELASLVGNEDRIRFERLEQGSVVIAFKTPKEYYEESERRIIEAASGQPDASAAGVWRKINNHLEKDGWKAELPLSNGKIINFPGKISPLYPPLRSIVQRTSIQGRLIRIEGAGDMVKVGLEIDGDLKVNQIALGCVIATELAGYFHKNVRLNGDGKWGRDSGGGWYLESINVTHFEALQDCPLQQTLEKLESIIPHSGAKFLIDSIDEMRQA